jgi:pSer/pThr/pTyr-binding forkhead associated (FHA) protein
MPSHLVLDATAYRLGETPLRIGAELSAGEYGLVTDSRHGGVSRRHCSVEFDAEQAILSDYSRYGTRLNGHRVDGSVVLQAGDVISIGDPPCELKLIAETGPDGT